MKLFGLEITRSKVKNLSAVPTYAGAGWFGIIHEGFAGAFQSGMTVANNKTILAFSAVYACITLIAGDIAKLCLCLMEQDGNVWIDVTDTAPHARVLRSPNGYQTLAQFLEQWVICKLLYGNVYVLKERDARGIVIALHILDSQRVVPLVASDGGIYYQLSRDDLAEVPDARTVRASEIIHDRFAVIWGHPLVGVSPIYACGMSATMGVRIQGNSEKFFKNMSQPSGMLTAPGTISDETAQRLKKEWQEKHGGDNMGGLAIAGDGLEYKPMTIPAQDAQLIEQLRWTVEDVARAFKVPLHMISSGPAPTLNTVSGLEQNYYSRTLQTLIEQLEQCLDSGLELPAGRRTEADLDGLLRMDQATLYEVLGKGVNGGWLAPNEARQRVNLPPVKGGDTPYLQQQNFSLAALDKRDTLPNPFVIDRPTANPTPSSDGNATQADPNANAKAMATEEIERQAISDLEVLLELDPA